MSRDYSNPVTLGKVVQTKFGKFEVIEKLQGCWYKIRFEDGYEKNATDKSIRYGNIKNPFHPHVKGVGYFGIGEFICRRGNNYTPEYEVWSGMLKRCYSSGCRETNPTYVDCTVTEEWHNFQNFAKWYTSQKHYGKGYHLDKDLIELGNRVYCPEKCSLIPVEVNSLFTGTSTNKRGVHWDNSKQKFVAQCHKGELTGKGNPKQSYLGSYNTEQAAREAYYKAKKEHMESIIVKYQLDLDSKVIDNLRTLCELTRTGE